MRNIGPKSSEWLRSIGVNSLEEMREKGVLETYLALRNFYPEANKNMLWAMVGADLDLDWREIPLEVKEQVLKKLEKMS